MVDGGGVWVGRQMVQTGFWVVDGDGVLLVRWVVVVDGVGVLGRQWVVVGWSSEREIENDY